MFPMLCFLDCHPEEGFSPTKDLRFLARVNTLPLQPNRRSFDSGA
jgi:hypothetical protein